MNNQLFPSYISRISCYFSHTFGFVISMHIIMKLQVVLLLMNDSAGIIIQFYMNYNHKEDCAHNA